MVAWKWEKKRVYSAQGQYGPPAEGVYSSLGGAPFCLLVFACNDCARLQHLGYCKSTGPFNSCLFLVNAGFIATDLCPCYWHIYNLWLQGSALYGALHALKINIQKNLDSGVDFYGQNETICFALPSFLFNSSHPFFFPKALICAAVPTKFWSLLFSSYLTFLNGLPTLCLNVYSVLSTVSNYVAPSTAKHEFSPIRNRIQVTILR